MTGLVTLGETMLVLRSSQPGPLRWGTSYGAAMAGCESNVAIGVSRLGHQAIWLGRVGNDEAGHLITATLRSEGINVAGVVTDDAAPTGLMMRTTRTTGLNQVRYFRSGSAGSRLSPTDIRPETLAGRQFLHTSGITAALNGSAPAAVRHALELAREAGLQTSFDVNHRSRLTTPELAAAFLSDIIGQIDVLFCGDDELHVLALAMASSDPVQAALDCGVREVIVKRGELGAQAHTTTGKFNQGAHRVVVADTIGAGDAFAAGYLSASMDGLGVAERLARAAAVAAFCVATNGDWEGLPDRSELQSMNPSATATVR